MKILRNAVGFAVALTTVAYGALPAMANYDGPWKLFDVNNKYFSELYRDNTSSTRDYIVFKSSSGNNWIFLDSAWDRATPGSGPYQGFWVTYQDNPGFSCNGPPVNDDIGISHNVWGYIQAYANPDGKNIQFDASRCDGPITNWAQTLE